MGDSFATSPAELIDKIFKMASLQLHPDKLKGRNTPPQRTHAITEAYKELARRMSDLKPDKNRSDRHEPKELYLERKWDSIKHVTHLECIAARLYVNYMSSRRCV